MGSPTYLPLMKFGENGVNYTTLNKETIILNLVMLSLKWNHGLSIKINNYSINPKVTVIFMSVFAENFEKRVV